MVRIFSAFLQRANPQNPILSGLLWISLCLILFVFVLGMYTLAHACVASIMPPMDLFTRSVDAAPPV
jgi:hypothetical protein